LDGSEKNIEVKTHDSNGNGIEEETLRQNKSEAVLSDLSLHGVDEPAQWLITALATQTILAFAEDGFMSNAFGLGTELGG
jgi:hypothetical protein